MKTINHYIPYFFLFPFFFFGCEYLNERRSENISQIGDILFTKASQKRFSDFFEVKENSFFSIGDWLMDFDYNPEDKKLYFTHLNILGCSKDSLQFSISISNDSIIVNEFWINIECKTDYSCIKQDIEYVVNNIEAKEYYIIFNKQEAVKLDLTNINEDWNYSLLKDGSYVIYTNEGKTSDEM